MPIRSRSRWSRCANNNDVISLQRPERPRKTPSSSLIFLVSLLPSFSGTRSSTAHASSTQLESLPATSYHLARSRQPVASTDTNQFRSVRTALELKMATDLASLSRPELQRLAKEHGLKANSKTEVLVEQLKSEMAKSAAPQSSRMSGSFACRSKPQASRAPAAKAAAKSVPRRAISICALAQSMLSWSSI